MRLAKSYAGYQFDETKAYDKGGKLYVKATCKCDRCHNGVYVTRVENGQPVSHPAYNGVCLKCGGSGVITKECRLYTDTEYEKAEKVNEKAAAKRETERENKMKAEFETKRAEWLEKNSYNENCETYIYFPNDSYNVKEELKSAGFRFDAFLLWHCSLIPIGYEDRVIKVNFNEVGSFSAWGEGMYCRNVKEKIAEVIKAARPVVISPSRWIGEEKDKLTDLEVKLTNIHGFESRYGYTQIVRFETANGDIIKWFTTSRIDFDVNDEVLLSGTIKKLTKDKYENDAEVTIVTRCKIKER